MSTVINDKKKYYIPKHRYYELKHHCLQYDDWDKRAGDLSKYPSNTLLKENVDVSDISDPTATVAMELQRLEEKMSVIDLAAWEADRELSHYILLGVTEGRSYEYLKLVKNIPCCKDVYYDRYRKFFWILDKKLN